MDLIVFWAKSIDVHKVLDSFLQIRWPFPSRRMEILPCSENI
jgi:hypothetical protein